MLLREVELPGVDAMQVRGVEVHPLAFHLAVKQLGARRAIPRELRSCAQADGRAVVQPAVVQPRSTTAEVLRRLRARGVLADVAGVVTPVVSKGKTVVFPYLIVRAEAEAVRMVAVACHLVVLNEVRLVRRLLPVACLLVGGVVVLAVGVRVKEVEREFSTIID